MPGFGSIARGLTRHASLSPVLRRQATLPHASKTGFLRACGSLLDSLCPGHDSSNRSPFFLLCSCSLHQPHQTQPHHRASVGGVSCTRLTRSSARALAGSTKRGGLEREMLLMAAEHQKRRRPLSADLLQNCDLPPPAKLLGPFPTLQRLESAAAATDDDSLLRALRLSQSRARRAEEKLAAAGAIDNGGPLAALLLRDSVALSAHRRWVMMLEAENSVLRVRAGLGGGGGPAGGADPGEHGVAAAWWVALAVCVGIAGVGLALGNLLL